MERKGKRNKKRSESEQSSSQQESEPEVSKSSPQRVTVQRPVQHRVPENLGDLYLDDPRFSKPGEEQETNLPRSKRKIRKTIRHDRYTASTSRSSGSETTTTDPADPDSQREPTASTSQSQPTEIFMPSTSGATFLKVKRPHVAVIQRVLADFSFNEPWQDLPVKMYREVRKEGFGQKEAERMVCEALAGFRPKDLRKLIKKRPHIMNPPSKGEN